MAKTITDKYWRLVVTSNAAGEYAGQPLKAGCGELAARALLARFGPYY